MEVKNVKGTKDVYGAESNKYQFVESVMKGVSELFGFDEMRPPVMEHSEVFVRGVGEGSDVVRKEMYTFLDKGERSLTLRPEFTAGIIRTIVQNKLYAINDLPLKFSYCGPVFRYERPQLGRYRQFNQFGVELVGKSNIYSDVEVIMLGYSILKSLGFEHVSLKINTLGDEESRNAYKEALKDFFGQHIEDMCPDCKSRFQLNPLRILDCKVKEDQEIVKHAPMMREYLTKDAQDRFENLLTTLELLDIPFEIDDTLVRGLDYYSETVFEFHYTSSLGHNYGAIGAGGHYDKLVSEFGGPQLSGVGFSFGVERIISVMTDDNMFPPTLKVPLTAYIIPMNEGLIEPALVASTALRMGGYRTEIALEISKLGSMIKKAVKKEAIFAVIIGEEELENNYCIVKHLETGEQTKVDFSKLIDFMDDFNKSQEEHHCCCGEDDCDCDDDSHEHHCKCGHHHKED